MNRETLYRQVHHLALRYHWSETDILALPRSKRLRYLSFLAEQAERAREEAERW